jgi:eukaryotic-like serine/threonine-protein kinase
MHPADPAADAPSHTTLLRGDAGPSSDGSRRTSWWTLPADVVSESVRRIRALAWIYAGAYFLAGLTPLLISEQGRAFLLSAPANWLPTVLSITGGLAAGLVLSHPGLSDKLKLRFGLVFEVIASFGIAAAEYQNVVAPMALTSNHLPAGFGLSWVAPWVMLFSVIVPARPVTTMIAGVLSMATVPLTYAAGVALGSNLPLGASQFFFWLVFPYLIVLGMAYVGARVVFRLGAAVREARELGSYRLRQRLGAGGMGEVWRAEHRLLARPAAIKLIRPEVLGATDPESRRVLVRRFEREAQATALMRSAHTVELYDFGVTDDGTFYYVMELLEGFDLRELVSRGGPVPPERAVHLLRQMCDSLAEAHAGGLIHRDIKPANVFACRYGRKLDFVKVLDFGLVKHGERRADGADQVTGVEQIAGGTPAFMSPEQAMGDAGVDGRSDLYAAGCVAYWLLTGSVVFQGRTTMETILMHAQREPEPPSRRTGQPIPPALELIVLDCLAKDPAARPGTADELSDRLAAVPLAGEWTPARASEWWSRHRSGTLTSDPGPGHG